MEYSCEFRQRLIDARTAARRSAGESDSYDMLELSLRTAHRRGEVLLVEAKERRSLSLGKVFRNPVVDLSDHCLYYSRPGMAAFVAAEIFRPLQGIG